MYKRAVSLLSNRLRRKNIQDMPASIKVLEPYPDRAKSNVRLHINHLRLVDVLKCIAYEMLCPSKSHRNMYNRLCYIFVLKHFIMGRA